MFLTVYHIDDWELEQKVFINILGSTHQGMSLNHVCEINHICHHKLEQNSPCQFIKGTISGCCLSISGLPLIFNFQFKQFKAVTGKSLLRTQA